jgi:hypothetical protein
MFKKFVTLSVVSSLAACSSSSKPVTTSTSCAIDVPRLNSKFSSMQSIDVSGWAFYKNNSNPVADEVLIQLTSFDGKRVKIFETKSVQRPDLVSGFNDKRLLDAGFFVAIPPNTIESGSYKVVVRQNFPNNDVVCGTAHTIKIE